MHAATKFKISSFFKQLILYPIFMFLSLSSWVVIGMILSLFGVSNPLGDEFKASIFDASNYGMAIGLILVFALGIFFARLCFRRKGKSTSYQQYHPEYEKPEITVDADIYDSDNHKIGTAKYHQDGDSGVRKHLTGWGLLSYLSLPMMVITKSISLVLSFLAIFIIRLVVSVSDYMYDIRKHGFFFDMLFYLFDISVLE